MIAGALAGAVVGGVLAFVVGYVLMGTNLFGGKAQERPAIAWLCLIIFVVCVILFTLSGAYHEMVNA
ncbi:hypothetical protein [Ruficoccus sp. ZRK36]|uniref:hypothetical protein n=1 Tax=Ruficoccus sp. ZRK36 TaxID=2866311 RepID=UPI001C72EC17|nr:hypothetical protein [Ruficoccus sp. ZRK36]QYY35698.1 hypothetical protein K0V07_15535 [Ruficoccus sp. ZRK36]